jgi:general secretion pathway protein I
VLVAVSILGLGLTVILSSQAGLFASSQRVEHLTQSANLMRCKMSEVELELLQMGFPLIDKTERGSCCADDMGGPYSCEWTIQTIELPQPASFGGEADGSSSGSLSSSGVPGMPGMGAGNLGQLSSTLGGIGQNGAPASLSDVTEAMSQAMPEGGGLLQMAVGMVYPTLKPMLEASIRKVTVHVRWREGRREQELTAVQYVTNPLEGGLSPNAANLADLMSGGMGIPGMTGGQTSPGATPGANAPGGNQ